MIVPSLQYDFILGSDFCRQFGIKVDFKQGVWYPQDKPGLLINMVDNPGSNFQSAEIFSLDYLSEEQRLKAQEVIASFKDISSDNRIGTTHLMELDIDTGDNKPVKQR